jgi:DNA-binding transcriptional MerR regulator
MPERDNKDQGLTAAECAARTGLTVRALRVYEDYGLIAPKRTASGWRWYGKAELVRLNTIGLLKTAGLTLSQIRQVTMLSELGPPLGHVLEMQIDAWRQRKADGNTGRP